MKRVYLVIGSDVEGSAALRAFTSRKRAQECVAACIVYEAKRPIYPDSVEESPENDEAWDRACAQMRRWERRHPGGPGAWHYSTYGVQAMPVRE